MKWLFGILGVLSFLFGLYWLHAQFYKPKGHYHLKFRTHSEGEYFVANFKNDTLYTLNEDGTTYNAYGWVLPLQKKLTISHCLEIDYSYFYDNDTLKIRYLDGKKNDEINYFGPQIDSKNCNKVEHYFSSCNVKVDLPLVSDSTNFFRLNSFYKGVQIGIPKDKETRGDSVRMVINKFQYWVGSLNDANDYLMFKGEKSQSGKETLFVYADKNVRIKDIKEYLLQIPPDQLTSWLLVFQSKQNQDDLFYKAFRVNEMNWEQIDDNELLADYVLNQ
jgi:hypothetical protein